MTALSLRSAQSFIRRELAAASDEEGSIRARDLTAREHEARAGEAWLAVKAELARRDIDADGWCRNQLGVTMRSMEHRAYLHKHWAVYKAAWLQAPQEGMHGLVYALALIRRELGRTVRAAMPPRDQPIARSGPDGGQLLSQRHGYIVEARQRISASVAPAVKPSHQTIRLSSMSVLYHDDCVPAMRHTVANGSIDVIVADPPFYLPRDDRTVIDYYLNQNGMKPRFREAWDDFQSFDDYVSFTERWIDAAFGALAATGSMFIWTTFHNAGAVNYALQRQGRKILNNIIWLKRNPRPVLSTRRLQFSHDCIVWVAKTDKYHFNYDETYAANYEGDSIKKQGRQHRDVIEASVAAREAPGHPSVKPVSVYMRLLDIAGKAGGVLLDPFAGSGTAAIAASRWGMRSILIERETRYLDIIKARASGEIKGGMKTRQAS